MAESQRWPKTPYSYLLRKSEAQSRLQDAVSFVFADIAMKVGKVKLGIVDNIHV